MSAKTKTTKATKASTKLNEAEIEAKIETPKPVDGGVKVKAIKPFFDLQGHCNRLLDDEFICTTDRANRLAKNGFVEVL